MSRCVIVGGAPITDYDRIKGYLKSDDFTVYCDSGLYHREKLGAAPSLIVGDFDSHENPEYNVETIVLPCEKDDTDTVFAVKQSLMRGYTEFLLIGVIGARLDHTLANVYLLEFIQKNGAHGMIADDYGEMEIVGQTPVDIPDSFCYFSLISFCGDARGVYIENAKYPLTDAVITSDYQYGVSNEPLENGATVRVREGKLLLIKIK